MQQNDLYLKYAEIIKMCQGTALDNTPWVCVKISDGFESHPRFTQRPERYKFAIAILEDKPVFVGDVLYSNIGLRYIVTDRDTKATICLMNWQQPKPKRTFELRGVELPCPVKYPTNNFIRLGICLFSFNAEEDAELVLRELTKILTEARDKP